MTERLALWVGLPRAGSGWHYNLVHDLVVTSGGREARQVRRRFFLQRILTEVNCNIGNLRAHRLLPVMAPVFLGQTFTVKTHAGPTSITLALIRRGWITPTYIYRDPRAALLSAYEYGQRGLTRGRPNAFSQLESLDRAGKFMQAYVRISEAWLAVHQALPVRYESLVQDYPAEVQRLLDFLGLQAGEPVVQSVIDKYRPERGSSGQRGAHFSQGEPERFRQVFSKETLSVINQTFADYLQRMGYSM